MSTQLHTIRQIMLALLFVALAALALLIGPGGRAESNGDEARSVGDDNRVGIIERADPDTLSSLDRG